jgi:hypothetical protein
MNTFLTEDCEKENQHAFQVADYYGSVLSLRQSSVYWPDEDIWALPPPVYHRAWCWGIDRLILRFHEFGCHSWARRWLRGRLMSWRSCLVKVKVSTCNTRGRAELAWSAQTWKRASWDDQELCKDPSALVGRLWSSLSVVVVEVVPERYSGIETWCLRTKTAPN